MARRHGWPRKNEGVRIYRERKGAHLIVFPEQRNYRGHYDAIANALEGDRPTLGSASISPEWLLNAGVSRVQWSEIPEMWQNALREWLDDEPETYRGLWLVNNQPARLQNA